MEKIITGLQGRKKATTRLTRSSKLFKTIIAAIHDKKGDAVVSLDMRKIDEAVSDFFILCQASNPVQVKAIADNIEEEVRRACDERPYHLERGEQWTLVDYVNIVVHIFTDENRKFYDLESLWMDAGRMEHADPQSAVNGPQG